MKIDSNEKNFCYDKTMIKELFIGRSITHFHINPIVKAFIISECFLWSAWNFITPIFAIFATTQITGGTIEIAAFGYSIHLISRVVFELIFGKYLMKSSIAKMLNMTIGGILLVTIAYLGFVFTNTIYQYFFFYAIAGIGFGIASPAKNTLFSTHMDKHEESIEWGLTDATVFIAIAMASAIGGFVAGNYGFRVLFILSAIINVISIIPYFLYYRDKYK